MRKSVGVVLSAVLAFGLWPAAAFAEVADSSDAPLDTIVADADGSADAVDVTNDATLPEADLADMASEPVADVASDAESLEQPMAVATDDVLDDDGLADGDYLIVSGVSPLQVLDVAGGSRDDWANVAIYDANMTGAQRWRVAHDAKGYVSITCIGSGKNLDVAAGKALNGTNIHQYTPNGTPAQKWRLSQNADGSYSVLSAINSAFALDIQGASAANGANVQLWEANGTPAQRFKFVPLAVEEPKGNVNIDEGFYELASVADPSLVVDVSGGSVLNGVNVQMYAANTTLAQLFYISPDPKSGYYEITCANSGKNLDVRNGCILPGTNVQQHEGGACDAQLWAAVQNPDGSVTFLNKANGLALAIADATPHNGTNVQCSVPAASNQTAAASQSFKLTQRTDQLPEGMYSIFAQIGSYPVLDVRDISRDDGANVQIYQGAGTQNQKWVVVKVEGEANTYKIRSVRSGLYLAMDANGNVCQRRESSDGSQWWIPIPEVYGLVLQNVKDGRVLDVAGASCANGTNVQGYERNGTPAQRFKFSPTPVLGSGLYSLSSAANNGIVLDVDHQSYDSCANVHGWSWGDTGNQKWYTDLNPDGTVTFRCAQSEKALDVAGGAAAPGTNVWQYDGNGSAAQRWRIRDNGDGTFVVLSALGNNLALTLATGAHDGSNLILDAYRGDATQRFLFNPTYYVPIPPEQRNMRNRINGLNSATQYLIAVDCSANRVGVFQGWQGHWDPLHFWMCTTGAWSSPTRKGYFTIQDKGMAFGSGYTCWYYSQFSGNYLFHSVLYQPGSMSRIQDGRLGINASHGCVRLDINNARWIYNNAPRGTRVVVY